MACKPSCGSIWLFFLCRENWAAYSSTPLRYFFYPGCPFFAPVSLFFPPLLIELFLTPLRKHFNPAPVLQIGVRSVSTPQRLFFHPATGGATFNSPRCVKIACRTAQAFPDILYVLVQAAPPCACPGPCKGSPPDNAVC